MARRLHPQALAAPEWDTSSRNFQRHYQEHPLDEIDCWRDIVSRPPPPGQAITRKQYADGTSNAYLGAWLEWEGADFAPADGVFHEERVHRFNPRLIRVIASADRTRVVTCYHEHMDRKHAAWRATPPLEAADRLLRWIGHRIPTGQTRLRSIRLLKGNLPAGCQHTAVVDALSAQVKAIAEKAGIRRS